MPLAPRVGSGFASIANGPLLNSMHVKGSSAFVRVYSLKICQCL